MVLVCRIVISYFFCWIQSPCVVLCHSSLIYHYRVVAKQKRKQQTAVECEPASGSRKCALNGLLLVKCSCCIVSQQRQKSVGSGGAAYMVAAVLGSCQTVEKVDTVAEFPQCPCVRWGNLRLESCELVLVCEGGGGESFDLLLLLFFFEWSVQNLAATTTKVSFLCHSCRILWLSPIVIVIYGFVNIKVKRLIDCATETFYWSRHKRCATMMQSLPAECYSRMCLNKRVALCCLVHGWLADWARLGFVRKCSDKHVKK